MVPQKANLKQMLPTEENAYTGMADFSLNFSIKIGRFCLLCSTLLFHFQLEFQSSSRTSTTLSLFSLKFCYSRCLGVVMAAEGLYPLRMAIIYCCKFSDPCRDPATMFMQISAVLWPWIIPVDTVSADHICS